MQRRPTEERVLVAEMLYELLSPKQQQAVTLRCDGWTQQEIAEMEGVTQPAIYYRLRRAKRTISLYEDGGYL